MADSYEFLKAHFDRISDDIRREHVANRQCCEEMSRQRDELLSALKAVVSSGAPCQREHPSMWDAWQKAMRAIDIAEGRKAR